MVTTIKDIAREAGLNISTVSRALNNAYGVNEQTRSHVIAVAARLGYQPNRVARSLVTGQSHSLALVVSDIRNPFFAEVARGAEDAARAGGHDLILCNSDFSADKQMQYVGSLLEKRIDGILMNSVSSLDRKQQEQLAICGIPIVLLNRADPGKSFSTVCADNEAGGALVAQYLLRLGHHNIGHLTGPRHHGNMTDRARGFLRALQNSGMKIKPVILYGENSFQGGYRLAVQLLSQKPRVTAIFAANDVMAFGAVRAILEAGLDIPGDISIIGFDNIELSSVMHVPLTTIHQPKYKIGHAAVEVLLHLVGRSSGTAPEHRLFGVEFIERQSCRELTP
jgi:LacI family transcriptional regulator